MTRPRVFVWSETPCPRLVDFLQFLGGSLLLTTGPLWVDVDVHDVDHVSDFFNAFVGGKLSRTSGMDLGFRLPAWSLSR